MKPENMWDLGDDMELWRNGIKYIEVQEDRLWKTELYNYI